MKHRLLSLITIVPLLLVVVGSGIMGSVIPALSPGTASAASADDYIFKSPNGSDFLNQLNDVLQDSDQDNTSVLNQTSIYAKSGVFGNTPTKLSYNKDRTGCAQAAGISLGGCSSGVGPGKKDHFGGQDSTLYVYSIKYSCEKGKGIVSGQGGANSNDHYVVDYNVSVNLAGDHAIFDDNGKLNSTVRLHWAGFSSITHWPAAQDNSQRKSDKPSAADLPADCRPSMSDKIFQEDAVGEDKGAIVNYSIPVYSATTAAIRGVWDEAGKESGTGDTLDDVAASGELSDEDTPALNCKAGFNPLNWVVCAIVKGLVSIIGNVDNLITSQMTVGSEGASDNPNQIFCDASSSGDAKDSCKAYHDAWRSFRNIALGLLVIAGLVVLVAQAIGAEIMDAYTIRKVLPRLLIAAVGITLSWQLMQFFVELTNDLGLGIRHLIYAPFSEYTNTVDLGGANDWAVTLATGGAVAAMGIFGLLSFVATAALAVFVAFLILILRQLVIIMLIIIAPIAIIMYILPNTQKTYKLWWESFSKALLMFPLIAGLIASGRVFAAVASSTTNNEHGGNPINALIAFAAYFAPYFALPLTFKFAGGALRGIGGFVNDRSKGGFDRLRNFRGNTMKSRAQKMKDGGLLNEDTWNPAYNKYAQKFNRATAGTANLKNAGYNPYQMKNRMAAARSIHGFDLAKKALAEDHDLQYILANDDIAEALLPDVESYRGSGHKGSLTSDAAARQFFEDRGYTKESGLEEMVALHRKARSRLPAHALEQAAWTANWSTGTGFAEKEILDENGKEIVETEGKYAGQVRTTGGSGEALQQLASMTKGSNGGDQLRANMLAAARQGATSQRRSDFYGQSFTEQMLLARKVASEGGMDTEEITQDIRMGAAKGKSRGEHITGRPQAIKAMVPQFKENFNQILHEGNQANLMQELAMARAGQTAASQASPENARVHAEYMNHAVSVADAKDPNNTNINPDMKRMVLAAAKIKANSTGQAVDEVTVQDMTDAFQNDRQFSAMVYNYSNQFAAASAEASQRAAQAQAPGSAPGTPPGGIPPGPTPGA